MKLEDAIELVLKTAKKYGQRSVEECDEIFEATGVVEDFFVNNVFDGTE
jgi:hypothetical protein